MSADLIEAIMAYALIPIFVIGLLIVVFIIAQAQLGLFTSHESASTRQNKSAISEYIFVVALFLFFTVLTFIARRRPT